MLDNPLELPAPDAADRRAPTTMARLLELVANEPVLTPARRRNLTSSIRRFCEVLGYTPDEAPAAFWFFRERIQAFAPASTGMTRKRWQTIKSDVSAALRQAGISPKAPKPRNDLGPQWRRLQERLAAAGRKHWGLYRLARFAEARGIAPCSIDNAVMAAFHTAISRESFKTDPSRHHRATCLLWNKAADLLPDLGLRKVAMPSYRERYTPDWEALPAPFRADTERWLTQMSREGDLLDEDAPARPLRPSSIVSYRYIVRQIVAGLAHHGRPLSEITSLACLVEVEAAKSVLQFHLDRNDGKTSSTIANIAHVLVLLAETAVAADPADVARLKAFRRKLAVRQRGLRERPKAALRPLVEPANIERVLMLPERIFAEARRQRSAYTRKDALRMQAAVALELLLMRPIRRKNLVALRLGEHVISTGTRTIIAIAAHDVKNDIDLEHPLPKESADLLDFYVRKVLPLLGPNPGRHLFPGTRVGRPKSAEQLGRQFTRLIRDETGLHLYPHVMRHFAASLYLRERPGEYETVRRVLAHKSLTTTTRSYVDMEDAAAVERFDALVLGIRSAIRREIGDA